MEATSSDNPRFEGLRIAHNVSNELTELNNIRLVQSYRFCLRVARSIIKHNDEVNRRKAQFL